MEALLTVLRDGDEGLHEIARRLVRAGFAKLEEE
jgi:hypothetical protein